MAHDSEFGISAHEKPKSKEARILRAQAAKKTCATRKASIKKLSEFIGGEIICAYCRVHKEDTILFATVFAGTKIGFVCKQHLKENLL